ncbi:hypothetical protein XA26_50230 [Mycolicibacterium fortuitum]|uniref:Uncharacterized protein n=1 Tax=Mycolicibacterium fortuitum TaxID=1766 RepID=A0A0N9XXE3_MYCFO|nr:hypothetical protein XA26_50230 [Mycolicibacterium fortuitum]
MTARWSPGPRLAQPWTNDTGRDQLAHYEGHTSGALRNSHPQVRDEPTE